MYILYNLYNYNIMLIKYLFFHKIKGYKNKYIIKVSKRILAYYKEHLLIIITKLLWYFLINNNLVHKISS